MPVVINYYKIYEFILYQVVVFHEIWQRMKFDRFSLFLFLIFLLSIFSRKKMLVRALGLGLKLCLGY